MKSAVVFLACFAFSAALSRQPLSSTFSRPLSPPAFKSNKVYSPPTPAVQPVRTNSRVTTDDRSASVLKQGSDISPDGSYNYFFETDNGIAAQEQGTPRDFGGNPPVVGNVAEGSYSWTSPEGQVVAIAYVADENGYQPSGEAIPTPPPVPPQIARALEWIAQHPQN